MASSDIITLRLPEETRELLDALAQKTGRSRSHLVREALEQHLHEIAGTEHRTGQKAKIAKLLSMAGAGAKYSTYGSAGEVVKTIREFRGDD